MLVVGIATIDAIARNVERLPPPGGLLFFQMLDLTTGGCALNAAIALCRLGTGADLTVRVGADPLGDIVVSAAAHAGLDTGLHRVIRDDRRSTSFSFVAVAASGERRFLHMRGANDNLRSSDVPDSDLLGRRFVFVTGSMLMGALDGTQTADLLARARRAGAKTMLDTVYAAETPRSEWERRLAPSLADLDYFVPSLAEAQALTGRDDPGEIASVLLDRGPRRIILKLGERGALLADNENGKVHVPAYRVEQVVDTTGAGDCWCAGLLAGLCEGQTPVEAIRLGCAAAAMSIGHAGATTGAPTREQAARYMLSTPLNPLA
ncbi:MAG: carbohydrate kinase family protein [Phycisphaerae bacterium]|nr:carbohydrate kinase family protein [Phycisphaerae bacterium]